MRLWAAILALALLLAVALSCNLAEKLQSGEDDSATVANLWPDVPPFPGATKSNKKLPIRNRFVYTSVLKGKASFITFSTDKSPQEVKDFYSGRRMSAAGWIYDDESCFSGPKDMPKDMPKDTLTADSFCSLVRGDPKNEALMIVVQPESSGATIFYMRMDITGPVVGGF